MEANTVPSVGILYSYALQRIPLLVSSRVVYLPQAHFHTLLVHESPYVPNYTHLRSGATTRTYFGPITLVVYVFRKPYLYSLCAGTTRRVRRRLPPIRLEGRLSHRYSFCFCFCLRVCTSLISGTEGEG